MRRRFTERSKSGGAFGFVIDLGAMIALLVGAALLVHVVWSLIFPLN